MNEDQRARCLRSARLRVAAALLPLGGVIWLASHMHPLAAVAVFIIVLSTIILGTLVPRCTLFGSMISRLPDASTHALLTIDDGPHPEHTPVFLDLLDRHKMKAIFFLVGERAAAYPELTREIAARGHEIGNHTQTHPAHFFWALRPARLWREIADCQHTLSTICPERRPRFFRPPAGHHNMFLGLIIRALGLRMVMWSARGLDGVSTDVAKITQRIRRHLAPGAIVLIHEGTPVALEVAEAVTTMIATAGLASDESPSLALGHDEVVVERRVAP